MARILIVDDHPNARKLLVCQLESEGHAVIECSSGKDGLKAARQENPDLVITDSNMPEMSGIEFVAGLRELTETQDTPVIFHTASGDDHAIRKICSAYNVAGILTKPSPAEEMRAAIRSALKASLQGEFNSISTDLQSRTPAYLASCDADVATMESALVAGDLANIQNVGHNLKGTGAAYGFSRITRIGDRLEVAAMTGDRTEIVEQLRDLACYLRTVTATGAEVVYRTESGSKQC